MNPTAIQFHFQTNNPDIRSVQGTNVHHTFPYHIHASFSLGIIQKGQRTVHIDGRPHIISANECFIINPHQPHSCSIGGERGHNYWVISITPKLFQDVFREATGKDGTPHFSHVKITDSSIINGFTVWLEKQTRDGPANRDELAGVLRELVLQYADEEIATQPKQTRRASVVSACKCIEANLNRPIRLDEIAEAAHLSPFYLNRIFREEIGIPPYTYLLQTRIKKSLELLLQTDSISEATYYLGFADQSHFSRFFKKNVGITPGCYLDLHKSSTP